MTTAMRDQYEYLVETITKVILAGMPYTNEQMQTDLNKRGADGWELITLQVMPSGQNQVYVQYLWKRKIVETLQ